MTRRNSVGLLLVAATLVGCAADETTETIAPTSTTGAPATTLPPTTTTSTLGVNVRYESVFDMRERLEAGGFECTDWNVRGSNDYSTESADCTPQVVMAIYPDASAIVDQRELRHQFMALIEAVALEVEGPNWNVSCDRPVQCDQIQSLLGGEVLEFDLTEG